MEKQSILKRPGVQTLIASILCAILGIVIGYIILLCINPQHAFEAIIAILKNFFKYSKSPDKVLYYFGSTLVKSVPLILCAEAILFAYKAGLFNIGAAGQYTMGIMASLFCAHVLHLPWFLCVLAAMAAGALWGAICGAFKALFNVNEVIAGIMLNWIGLYLTNIILSNETIMDVTKSETYALKEAAPQALLPSLGLGKLFGDNPYVTLALPLAVIVAIVILFVLNKTTFGYELKATGNNKDAAKYAGMNAKRNIILTLVISGAIAGLAASTYYLTDIESFKTASSVPGMGFSGIAVAFLGGLNPIGAIFAGYFIEHITLGGQFVNTNYYNPQVAELMVAIIIYLCGFVLFIRSILNKVGAKKEREKLIANNANAETSATATQATDKSEGEV